MIIYASRFDISGRDHVQFDFDGGEPFIIDNLNFEEVLNAMELSMREVDSTDLTPLDYNNLYCFDINEEEAIIFKLNDLIHEEDYKWIVENQYNQEYNASLYGNEVEESYMTVAEMIRALQEMPQDAKVIFTGSIDHHRGTTQCGDFGAPSITLEDYHTYEDEENEEEVKIEGPLVKIALYGDATYRE